MAQAKRRPDPATMALIEDQLPLVRHVVFQVAVHFPRHVDRDDLARAGALGLVEAARRWDPDRGVPFDRFVARRIRGAILDAVRAADWAPRSVRSVGRRLARTEQELTSELGRVPSPNEVAERLGVAPSELARLSDRVYRSVVLALEQPVQDGDDNVSLIEVLRDTDQPSAEHLLEDRELLAYVHDAISLLPERHRLVIVGYFLDGHTSADLARFLGVTESRVSQLRSEALEMLRDGIEAQYDAPAVSPGRPDRRVGVRWGAQRADYAAAIAAASRWQSRLDHPPRVLPRAD
ncbi:sigma-70 family RNA polymerase sigma factor [Rhabdothermincola salaria]|uniref:sigma-70 family RNA polymerase sigma factor n=1 Tax=Rhabdothermincola salaria TaxID=2903142 RepID=UPI001E55936F|nr:sigma-70 family RNA polymerase sigma factor [Rhabdothermincola salaria]MCD9624436.1 sigma-70 family RNA polymerase sigma factor [Rhabdothermincola salaria]